MFEGPAQRTWHLDELLIQSDHFYARDILKIVMMRKSKFEFSHPIFRRSAVTHVRTCCLNRDDDVFTLEPGVEIVTLFLAKNLKL